MTVKIVPLRTPGRAPRVLTIDVEEWFHVCGDEYWSDPRRWDSFAPRVERSVAWLFDRLARGAHRATFFFLGWIAERYPQLLAEAVRRGHEVGVHGHHHLRAHELTPAQFREDLRRARDLVERAAGVPVRLHRAAEWSIRGAAEPAVAVLAEEGFVCDASITSVPVLGRAGNEPGPHRIELSSGQAIVEIPPLTGRGFGRTILMGGSWPFRMFSLPRLARAEEAFRSAGRPAVFTFHPWEVDARHPPMEGLSPLLALVRFWNLEAAPDRFEQWLAADRCIALGDVLPELAA
jgi:polysaccharide deacetylase family protein (PEP-CTERM system associated)